MLDDDTKENSNKKEPIEMTTDEALDYLFHPKIANELRREARQDDLADEPESDD